MKWKTKRWIKIDFWYHFEGVMHPLEALDERNEHLESATHKWPIIGKDIMQLAKGRVGECTLINAKMFPKH